MAHELETINGRTAFATARKPAWHQLGTVTTGCMTAAEVITTALLADWNVRKIFVAGHTPDGATIPAPDKAMTVRTNPVTGTTDYLGVVGRDYVPVQNEACAELLDLLVDASGAHYETAGSLRGGTTDLHHPAPARRASGSPGSTTSTSTSPCPPATTGPWPCAWTPPPSGSSAPTPNACR